MLTFRLSGCRERERLPREGGGAVQLGFFSERIIMNHVYMVSAAFLSNDFFAVSLMKQVTATGNDSCGQTI